MASWIVSRMKHIWPFSGNKTDDLKVSDSFVRSLPVHESTKQFVFALRDPDYPSSVVYLLAAESLSERSASDAECLVRAIKPKVVVAQIGPSALDDIREEEKNLNGDETCSVPTSWLGVLKGCFVEKIVLSQYESRAGSQILHTIFGTGFYGHVLAAKKAAQENHSLFFILETPHRNGQGGELGTNSEHDSKQDVPNKSAIKPLAEISQGSGLLGNMTPSPGDMASSVPMGSHRHILASPLHSSALKALASSMAFTSQNLLALDSGSNCGSTASSASSSAGCDFRDVDQIPAFAHSFYSLLVDLHDMFNNLPALERALVCVRKMLLEVEKGKEVDCEVLSHVNKFRIAVEGLRVALNSKARSPLKQEQKLPKDADFYELPYEDKCHALFAQALKRQAKDFGTVVAIVDASSFAGIRSYWNTSLPRDVADLADNCFISDTFDDASEGEDPKRRNVLGGKPVVAVGAGAATVVGVTSFSKIVPVSTIAKMVTFKVPTIVKFGLLQTKRTAAVALGKVFTPAKLLAPASKGIIPGKIGFGYGVHVPATAKTAAAAEKLRAATHSVIAAAERSSLSAMRTAFYGIMRKRHGKATGGTPWVSFGGSILACTGLLAFGDGTECAVESAHAMPTIARLGRGLEKLRHASQVVHQMDSVVVAMKGHPGSGKSTIARSLAQALKWPLLDKDDVRDSTLPIQNLLPSSSSGGLLNDLSYAVIWGMADTQLQLGISVVIDSPLSRPHLFHQIAALAARHGALLLVVECRAADSQEWRRRLEDRSRASPSWHKPSSWEALQELVEGYQGCYEYDMGTTRRLVVDTTTKVEGEAIAAEVLNWVRRADHEGTPTLSFVPSEK